MTLYVDRAYLGAGARGFEAGAQRSFGKSAANVSPSEAAMLEGLLKAPSTYAPTGNMDRARDRAAVVIGLMEEQGYLTKAEADEARAHPAELSQAAKQKSGGFFADWVMETTPDYLARDTTEDVIIETTLDQKMQAQAEEALKWVFDNKVKEGSKVQAAIVVMSADGAVRAMVGGRDLPQAGDFNRATQALRQTGSSFKPFIYAAAMDLGYSPLDYVDDSPLTINVPGSGPYSPKNYDGQFNWSDDQLYCSELVWKIYHVAGIDLGKLRKLKEYRFDHPIVKEQLRRRYGDNVPLEEPVIAPSDIFALESLVTVTQR